MELKARTIVEGLLLGLHRSPYRGFSAEFAEYRHYLAGDDPATIDWKVYARSDRYYVKKFEAETNLECNILLDTSASMGYGTGGITKLDYGACLAAAIAWLVSGQRDAVGLTTFDERITSRMPPRAKPGHLHTILIALERLKAGAKSDVAKPLRQLADALTKRGLIVLDLRSAGRAGSGGQGPAVSARARHGSGGVPRPRSGGADVSVRGGDEVHRHGIVRGDARGARRGARALSRARSRS